MICKKCGEEFDDMFDFCPMCGSPVKEDDCNSETIDKDYLRTHESAETNKNTNFGELAKNKKVIIGLTILAIIIVLMIAISGNSNSNYSSSDYSSDNAYETEADTSDTYMIPSGTYNVVGKMTNGVTEACYGEYITIQGDEAYGSVNGNSFSGNMEYWRHVRGFDLYYISTQFDNGAPYGIVVSYKDGTLYRWTEGNVDSENFAVYE